MKKTFKQSIVDEVKGMPAEAFITTTKPEQEKANLKRKSNREKRDVKINLLFTSSLKEKIDKIAYINRQSTNDLINEVLNSFTDTQADKIKKYDDFFNEGR